jgi:predicted urease superfamily metal-dependent hydrolase
MSNNIEKELIDLGIIDINKITEIHPSVRDNSNISVKKCNRSNVIYLSENDYINDKKYEDKQFID